MWKNVSCIACLTARKRVLCVRGRALRYKKLLTIFLPLRLMLEAKAFYSPRQKGARPQESIAPERQFLRTASSDFIDSHKGCLRKASLPCIKNCRFRGGFAALAGQFGMNDVQKGPESGLPGLFVHVRRQSRQPKPVAFCGSESKRGLCLKTALFLPWKRRRRAGIRSFCPARPGASSGPRQSRGLA